MKIAFSMKATNGDQKALAAKTGYNFEVHSKSIVSEEFKNWFQKNGIKFVEGLL